MNIDVIFKNLGLHHSNFQKGSLISLSPIDGNEVGRLEAHSLSEVPLMIEKATHSFKLWRLIPPPKRGELVRLYGEELRTHKDSLATLITLETGKILEESRGEVQEMIDMCDFAVGLSRQLYGLTIASERPGHRMMETWHPLGPIGVISPFNFPAAVWCWNFVLALVCGNPVLWKPSEKTPFTALASAALFEKCAQTIPGVPSHLLQLLVGGKDLGKLLVDSPHIPLISATGSTTMGKSVAIAVAQRLGRSLLELGGNNGMILTPSANLELAMRAIVFSAVGTTGQRCTTLRRLIVHTSLYDEVVQRLLKIYSLVIPGNPLDSRSHIGPLIDRQAFERMQEVLTEARKQGADVFGGERVLEDNYPQAYYVRPAFVEMAHQTDIVKKETFAPLLYIIPYKEFNESLDLNNDVPQGLSSCIFTNEMREAEIFLSSRGSDCGIANVNLGPSGAEIGGAFGGEKETGGGRESGSDAWKNYMRRATNTLNYSEDLLLAQGIRFDVE